MAFPLAISSYAISTFPPDVYVVKLVELISLPAVSVSVIVLVVMARALNLSPFNSVIPPTSDICISSPLLTPCPVAVTTQGFALVIADMAKDDPVPRRLSSALSRFTAVTTYDAFSEPVVLGDTDTLVGNACFG